jgi:DNA-binding transcriptional ArsR family regulator
MDQLEKVAKGISDKNRIRIINLLLKDSWRVSDIAFELELEENLASHHLRTLQKNGLVKSVKKGREVYYSINKTKITSIIRQLIKKPLIKEIVKDILKNQK